MAFWFIVSDYSVFCLNLERGFEETTGGVFLEYLVNIESSE